MLEHIPGRNYSVLAAAPETITYENESYAAWSQHKLAQAHRSMTARTNLIRCFAPVHNSRRSRGPNTPIQPKKPAYQRTFHYLCSKPEHELNVEAPTPQPSQNQCIRHTTHTYSMKLWGAHQYLHRIRWCSTFSHEHQVGNRFQPITGHVHSPGFLLLLLQACQCP